MKSPTLERADQIIHGERQDMYGSPEDCFDLIADYWNNYILAKEDVCLDASDVAILMTLFKIARMSGQKWHPDNAVDACGYLSILTGCGQSGINVRHQMSLFTLSNEGE